MIITDELAEDLEKFLNQHADGAGKAWGIDLHDQIKQNKAKLVAVRLDETHFWNEDLLQGARAFGVYLIDLNECTYCCEITPSYTLYPMYHYTDSEDESVCETVTLEPMGSEVTYMHCSGIDALLEAHARKAGPWVYTWPGKPISEEMDLEEDYDAFIRAEIESCIGNRPL